MNFYERRPKFRAVQFDGTTESAQRIIRDSFRIILATYKIEVGKGETRLTIDAGIDQYVLKQSDWLVCTPDGSLSVMKDDDFNERFEQVAP